MFGRLCTKLDLYDTPPIYDIDISSLFPWAQKMDAWIPLSEHELSPLGTYIYYPAR
jgi:hypothetical protein